MALRLVLAVVIGLVAGVWTSARPGDPALFPPAEGAPTVVVHVIDNGFHTDIAVPRALLASGDDALAQATAGLPGGDWVRVGWGDAVFYVEEGTVAGRWRDGARALFRPGGNPSVLRLEASDDDPERWPDDARRVSLTLSPAGAARLRAHISRSLQTDAQARPILTARRPGDGAVFYAVRDAFWLGRLCNHWTAAALNAAGLPMPMARAAAAGAVMRAARAPAAAPAAELDSRGAGD